MKRRGKRVLCLVLCLLALAACAPREEEEEERDDLIVVGISQVGAESDWRVANSESMKSTFTEEKGYRLLFDDARQKQENQITAIRKFIQQRVDYIVLMPISEAGWDSVLQEARDAGIPVILVDRMVRVEDESLYTSHVGSDFYQEGETAVRWLEEHRPGPLRIVHIQGTLGSTAQLGRTAALEEGAARHGDWTLLAQLEGDFTQAKTREVMEAYLAEDPGPIDVVYCENDNEAFGALEALEAAGRTCGPEGVAVVSFDATRKCLSYCLEGRIAVAVECNPRLGPLVEEVIRTLEAGGAPERSHYVTERSFSQRDLSEAFIQEREY